MMGVRYDARELWEFARSTTAACCLAGGACADLAADQCDSAGGAWQGPSLEPCPGPCAGSPGPAVDRGTAHLTRFCSMLLAVKPDLENAPLPLYFRVPIAGRGSLDVVFTSRAAFLGRLLPPRCAVAEGDIPADLRVPQEPPGTLAPGGDRDAAADVETFLRRADFLRQFDGGERCCPNPGSRPADLPDLSCAELDAILDAIRALGADPDEAPSGQEPLLGAIEALLRNRIHERFQRSQVVEALASTALSVEARRRISEALGVGEAFSDEAALIRLQLEREGLLDRPREEDEASSEAATILRGIDGMARAAGAAGLPRFGPVAQVAWSTLYKWSHAACCMPDGSCREVSHTPTHSPLPDECADLGGASCGDGSGCDPNPCAHGCLPPPAPPAGPRAPRTVGPEF
jgi:hypothetical protein